MIDKLKVFEVAWKEFVEWMKWRGYKYDQYFWITDKRHASIRELRSYLIEFLDSKGIYLSVGYSYTCWLWTIYDNGNDMSWVAVFEEEFSSRPEAEEQGIIKGFEIYNNQKEK